MSPKNESRLRFLLLTDVHYRSRPDETITSDDGPDPEVHRAIGIELIAKAIREAKRRGKLDAVIVLGDVIDDCRAPQARADLHAVKATLDKHAGETPILLVPGNHDGDPSDVLSTFEASDGVHEIGGYRFFVFADPFEDHQYCARRISDLDKLVRLAEQPEGPIIALQHNPIHPAVTNTAYPYMHTNREAILRAYRDAKVFLSLSGHYHDGQDLNRRDDTWYYTAPAFYKPPFRYAVVTIDGRQHVDVRHHTLKHEAELAIVDRHAHTEFAYCTKRITAAEVVARAKIFGLSGITLVEHAPQLYCCADDFWSVRHIREPETWKRQTHSRMEAFLDLTTNMRSDFVRNGLEVELDADGRLTLHDEDRDRIDLVVGAVHWLAEDNTGMTPTQEESAWLRTTEGLLSQGIDVLAHPLRYLSWEGLPFPTHLYREVARMLAASGTAAEINVHSNTPDPAFFAACLEEGVKISLGSDAHRPWECANFHPHLALLREAASSDEIDHLLL